MNRAIAAIALTCCATATIWADGTNDPAPTLWTQANLVGDPGGWRSRLEAHGLTLNPVYTGEVMGESGGLCDGNRVISAHLLALPLDLDLEKLAGWPGAQLHANAFWIAGRGLTEDCIGDLANVSNISAYRTARLNELWLQQTFWNQTLSLKAGALAMDSEFFSSSASALFINSSFGTFSLFAANLPNPPIFPIAAPGIRVAVHAGSHWLFQMGVFDGDSLAQDVNKDGLAFHLAESDGALILSEAQFSPHATVDDQTLGSVLKVGTFIHTKRIPTWDAQLQGDTTGGAMNYGFYGVIDQDIYKNNGRRISLFLRGGAAPGNRNMIGWYVDTGCNFSGFLPGRPNDVAGVAFARSNFSRNFSHYGSVANGDDDRRAEMVIETTYRAQLTPWWTLQPDFQVILTPDGQRNADTAVVAGLRTSVAF
ncbi:MAG TPA: carbohydrate porin [Verrucomicrobiae bacterium]